MGTDLKIERLEIVKDEFSELVPRNSAKVALTTPPLSNRSTSPEAKRSPADRSVIGQVTHGAMGGSDQGDETSIILPKSAINELGIPTEVMVFLEVYSIVLGIHTYDIRWLKSVYISNHLSILPSPKRSRLSMPWKCIP
jgi:hypothetical protein